MKIIKPCLSALFILSLAYGNAFASANCETGGLQACYQTCTLKGGMPKNVCSRLANERLSQCKALGGVLTGGTSPCGTGLNCNGCK